MSAPAGTEHAAVTADRSAARADNDALAARHRRLVDTVGPQLGLAGRDVTLATPADGRRALAFGTRGLTEGRTVYLAPNLGPAGAEVLVHELVHVAQQRARAARPGTPSRATSAGALARSRGRGTRDRHGVAVTRGGVGARRRAPCRRPRRRARRRRHGAQATRHRDDAGVRRARRAQRAASRRRRRGPAPGGDRPRRTAALRPGARAHRRAPERAVGRRRGRAQLPADPRHVPVPHRPRPRRQPADVEQDRPDGRPGDEPPPHLPGGRSGRALGVGADAAAHHQGGQRRGPGHPRVRRRRPAGGVERAPRAAAERAARADARRPPPVLRRPDQGPGAARQRPRRPRRAVAHPPRRLHRPDVARRRR